MTSSDRQVQLGHSTRVERRADGLVHALRITVGPHFTEKSERIVRSFLDDLAPLDDLTQLRAENGSLNRAVDRLEEVGMEREQENRALTEEVERLRDELSFFADGGSYELRPREWKKVDFPLQCRARKALAQIHKDPSDG